MALARNPNVGTLPVRLAPFVRKTSASMRPMARRVMSSATALLIFPANARHCVFIQGGKYLPTAPDALKSFYSTLEPIGK